MADNPFKNSTVSQSPALLCLPTTRTVRIHPLNYSFGLVCVAYRYRALLHGQPYTNLCHIFGSCLPLIQHNVAQPCFRRHCKIYCSLHSVNLLIRILFIPPCFIKTKVYSIVFSNPQDSLMIAFLALFNLCKSLFLVWFQQYKMGKLARLT